MEPTPTIDPLCFRCDRTALTFDEQHRPLCGRHALIFLSAARVQAKSDVEAAPEKASNEADDEAQPAPSGTLLRLVPLNETADQATITDDR